MATSKPVIVNALSVNGKGCGWPSGRGDGTYSSSVNVLNVARNSRGLYWHGIEASPLPVSLQTETMKKFMAITAVFCGGSEKLCFFA